MSKTLVAYFSHAGENYVSGNIIDLPKGNGQVIAEFAARATNGDLFEIARFKPYPTGYRDCVNAAAAEKRADARPELAATVPNMDDYDHVVLIYPNWCGGMPMAVYTFLESHDFTGKTIHPCCTHEGSGMSGSDAEVARLCPTATVTESLAVHGTHAAESQPEVTAWLSR